MKIGYKATKSDMSCRGIEYEMGRIYFKESFKGIRGVKEVPSLKLCSDEVFHYCDTLEDCFKWYSSNPSEGNRFFEIEILGIYKEDKVDKKNGTTAFRFLREIKGEELGKFILNLEDKKMKIGLGLDKIQKLQNKFPYLILGGSLALYLQGLKLQRIKNWWFVSDFDLIHPFYIDLQAEVGATKSKRLPSGCSFQHQYEIEGRKVDLRIDPECKYRIVEFGGDKYKVALWEDILTAKLGYIQNGGEGARKHEDDLKELLKLD